MIAANLKQILGVDFGEEGISFVTEGDARRADVWVYAPAEREVMVELTADMPGALNVTLDGGRPFRASNEDGAVRFSLPERAGRTRVAPPPDLAGKAPRDWPGAKRAIGVLNLAGLSPAWTSITPQDWLTALRQSRLAKEPGVPIQEITSVEALVAALKAGPTSWLAIINPHGEIFPATGVGQWRDMLGLVRDYVNHGGCWWETGGYSFYSALSPKAGGWDRDAVGPNGMGFLGLPVGGGDVDQPPESLRVTAEGQQWLGADLSARVAAAASTVNRGLPRTDQDPGHVALVAGERDDFIGGYRLDGWGWLWRIGGFNPDPLVVLPVAVAAMEHIYTRPPLPAVKAAGPKYLWHAVVSR
jgi:hypothetical protein